MPAYTYAEAEHNVLFREDEHGLVDIWRPATRDWKNYSDDQDYAETAKPINEHRAREIMAGTSDGL